MNAPLGLLLSGGVLLAAERYWTVQWQHAPAYTFSMPPKQWLRYRTRVKLTRVFIGIFAILFLLSLFQV